MPRRQCSNYCRWRTLHLQHNFFATCRLQPGLHANSYSWLLLFHGSSALGNDKIAPSTLRVVTREHATLRTVRIVQQIPTHSILTSSLLCCAWQVSPGLPIGRMWRRPPSLITAQGRRIAAVLSLASHYSSRDTCSRAKVAPLAISDRRAYLTSLACCSRRNLCFLNRHSTSSSSTRGELQAIYNLTRLVEQPQNRAR
jgi:hypothetical protein